jgi:photosystem II stability/assembly factor-like uncharacterized protein
MRRAFVAITVVLGLAPPAHAGLDAWTLGDQVGGAPEAVAIDGQYALIGVYGGGYGGSLLRSADGGATWQRATQMDFRAVNGVAIDPAAGEPSYAATTSGMFRSLDHGQTWAEIGGGLGNGKSYAAVAVDRARAGTAFFELATGGGVFRTATGGTGTWTDASTGVPMFGFDNIVVDPGNHRAWGTQYGGGVWTLGDGQSSWVDVTSGISDKAIRGLAIDRSDNPRVIVATTGGLWYAPADGPYIWTPINGGLSSATPYVTSLTADGAGNMYNVLLDRTIHRLASDASTWSDVPAGGRPTDKAQDVNGDPTTAGRVLATTTAGGLVPLAGQGPLWRTNDSGATWTNASQGVKLVRIEGLAPDPRIAGRVLVATSNDAVQRSQDGGATWAPAATGLTDPHTSAIVADGGRADTFYASSSGAGVLRSTDGGTTWAPVGTNDPSTAYGLASEPGTAGLVYATDLGNAYKSTDFGDSWAKLPDFPVTLTAVRQMLPDPAAPGAVYAATDKGLLWLAAGAVAWTDRSAGLPTRVFDVTAAPPSTLFAATEGGVYRSADGGLSWTAATNGIPDAVVSTVTVDPQVAGTVYAGTLHGVFRSTDNGATWAPMTGGAALPGVTDLVFDADGRTLYAATRTFGLAAWTRLVAPGPGPGPGPVHDTVAPVLTHVSLTRRRFAVGKARTPVSARVRRGTTLRLTLSERATLRIAVLRETHRHRRLRLRSAGTLTRSLPVGPARVAFSGRIGRRALRPARYRMKLVASDAAGNRSKALVLRFRIVRR